MSNDFTRYTPPGVYVQSSADSVVTPQGLPIATVTLVGSARGYQVATQTVTLSATAKPLSKKGVLPDAVGRPSLKVTTNAGTVLVENTDYTLVRGAGSSESTTIARDTDSTAVGENDTVTVSYAYSDANYYAPQAFDDYTFVENTYGPAMLTTAPEDPDASQVASPLSLAARIAFENGAGTVICLAVEPTTNDINQRTRFTQAYAKIATSHSVTLLVPVFDANGADAAAYSAALPGLISDARAHCTAAAGNGFGRIAFVGSDALYDDTSTTFDELAEGASSSRVVLAYPSKMSFYNNALGQSTEVGGCYLAAAFAGVLASNDINRGLTRQQVFGFTGIPETLRNEMTKLQRDTLSGAGVCVAEYGRNNMLQIRHGVSTDPSSLVTAEVSVTRASDALYELVAEGMEAADLIGDAIDEEMTTRVKGVVTGILETAVTSGAIRAYLDLQVRQQTLPSGDPTAIELAFTYQPFLPLNYITVSFSMDLSTNEVSVDDVIAA